MSNQINYDQNIGFKKHILPVLIIFLLPFIWSEINEFRICLGVDPCNAYGSYFLILWICLILGFLVGKGFETGFNWLIQFLIALSIITLLFASVLFVRFDSQGIVISNFEESRFSVNKYKWEEIKSVNAFNTPYGLYCGENTDSITISSGEVIEFPPGHSIVLLYGDKVYERYPINLKRNSDGCVGRQRKGFEN